MTELRFAELLAFVSDICTFIEGILLLLFIDLHEFIQFVFSNIFDILKTYDVIPCVCPLIDHGSRPMKSHEFLRLLYNM
jgi:hypothetical protein